MPAIVNGNKTRHKSPRTAMRYVRPGDAAVAEVTSLLAPPRHGRSPAWVVPGLVLAGTGLGIVMVTASAAIISGAPPQRAGMASSIESVSYELGSLAGVTVTVTILTALYTQTIRLPATAPAQPPAASTQPAPPPPPTSPPPRPAPCWTPPPGAFDNGYTLSLAITAIALAAGSAFTYRYLRRQPTPSTEQAQHATEGIGAAGVKTA